MWTERQRGATLVELIIAIIIIGVGLGGVLAAFTNTVRGSSDPVIRKQMLAIAEEMMEEIALKPYQAVTNSAPATCARDTYNDIFDYNGYASPSGGVCDLDGNAIATLAGYSVAVAVTQSALGGITAQNAAKIVVTVTHGSDDLTLTGWRTWYACDATTTTCPP